MNSKEDKRTHVLISLCGMSPAVITETVFALTESGDPPEQVIVITTSAGAVGLREKLWNSGVWTALMRRLPYKIDFSLNQKHLRLLPDGDRDAADVVHSPTVENAASFILDVLRQYTENPDTRITFSIAGGRKTMSALGALCMSLLGRHDDRLCHILVNPPFDDPMLNPVFYFPQPGRIHTDRNGNVYDSGTAELTLSDLPFVQCRYLLANELGRLPGDYVRMVELANRTVTRLKPSEKLELVPAQLTVRIGNGAFRLQFRQFLLYWMLAERRSRGLDHLYHRKDLYEEFVGFVEHVQKKVPQRYWYSCSALQENDKIREDTLNKRVSDLAAVLKKRNVPESFLPTRGRGIYGLGLEPGQIHIRTSGGSPESGSADRTEL